MTILMSCFLKDFSIFVICAGKKNFFDWTNMNENMVVYSNFTDVTE